MGKVIVGARISLDGYVNDPSGNVDPLYPDMATLRDTESIRQAIENTGAVVMGRKSFDMAEGPDDWTNYEFQVPIFVVTHHPPKTNPTETEKLKFTFVTSGIESAVRQAKGAAGDKDVAVVSAASVANQCLVAGLADEVQVDIMPIFLGGGLRPFEEPGLNQVKLERTKVMELPSGGVHIRYRVIK